MCTESVMVPRFLRDLLAIFTGLAQELTCNGSRPTPYIDEGVWTIEPSPHTFNPINSRPLEASWVACRPQGTP
jgi:hypothetical protein